MLPNVHAVYYGYDLEMRGLFLDSLDKIDLSSIELAEFKPGHRYLVIWNDSAKDESEQPYRIIKDKYGIHFGPRNESFTDYTKCPYLTTKDGIIFKFIYKKYERSSSWIDEAQFESMSKCIDMIKKKLRNAELDSGVSKRSGNRWYRLSFDKLKDVGTDIRDFCEKIDFVKPNPEVSYIKRIRTIDELKNSFEYFLSKPDDTIFGFDYETAYGFPMESPDFRVMGLGIASTDDAVAAYYDVQWMQNHGTDGEYDLFITYLNKFLDKFESSVAYNHHYEQKVTYVLTKRLCLFDEGATINKCEGRVYRNFSLKYTAQCVLGVRSWDDDFDLLTGEWLPQLFEKVEEDYKWKVIPDGKVTLEEVNDEGEVIYIEVDNYYKNSPVWKLITQRWPNESQEFSRLIESNYGEQFACIPSNIQAEYCCRDSYYTGLLKVECLKRFSELCYSTYNHNLQLESLLHLTGFFCDEDYRVKMLIQSMWLEVYGKLQVTYWALNEKMNWYSSLQIPEIPYVTKLISMGYDPSDSKSILMSNLSEDSDSGINEELIAELLGEDLLTQIKELIKEYCYRLDESYSRSRKLFNVVNTLLQSKFNPVYSDKDINFTVDGVDYHIDLSYNMLTEYYQTRTAVCQLKQLTDQVRFKDIQNYILPHLGEYNLPEKLKVTKSLEYNIPNDIEYTLDQVLEYCDSVFNYKSIKVSPYLKFMFFHKFKWLVYNSNATDYAKIPYGTKVEITDETVNQVRENKFALEYLDRMAKVLIDQDPRIKETDSWKKFVLNGDYISLLYAGMNDESVYNPETDSNEQLYRSVPTGEFDRWGKPIRTFNDDLYLWYDTCNEELTNWFDFMPKYAPYWCIPEDDYQRFHDSMDEIDITSDTVEAVAKFSYCYISAKKYNKVRTAYMQGEAFYNHNYSLQYFNEDGITPNFYEDKGVHKCYIPFRANEKKSKRWSSGYHTIPSKAEMKRIITTPPGYLLSYFDISGAEIRTISFMSRDEFMMNCYMEDKDPYITMASYTYPREDYPDMTDDEYKDYLKSWRGTFKQVLLGSLYGMGVDKMAELAEIDVETAEKVMTDLWIRCPGLKRFIEEKSTWAEEHPGYVQSALGDILELDESDGADRLARLGINQFIQNYSSTSLADGFMNVIETSIHHKDEKLNQPDFILRPAGVVHDSCQIYFPTKYLFEMKEYYERTLSTYLYDLHKILYAFDLEVGVNYFDMLELRQSDPTKITFKGNYVSLNAMLNKLVSDGLSFKTVKVQKLVKKSDPIDLPIISNTDFGEEFKPKLYNSIIEQFYDYGCYAKFSMDKSSYSVTIEKI